MTKEVFTYHVALIKGKFLQTVLLARNQSNLLTIIPESSTTPNMQHSKVVADRKYIKCVLF